MGGVTVYIYIYIYICVCVGCMYVCVRVLVFVDRHACVHNK